MLYRYIYIYMLVVCFFLNSYGCNHICNPEQYRTYVLFVERSIQVTSGQGEMDKAGMG